MAINPPPGQPPGQGQPQAQQPAQPQPPWWHPGQAYQNIPPSTRRVLLGLGAVIVFGLAIKACTSADRIRDYGVRQGTKAVQTGRDYVVGSAGYETDIWGRSLAIQRIATPTEEEMCNEYLSAPAGRYVPVRLEGGIVSFLEYRTRNQAARARQRIESKEITSATLNGSAWDRHVGEDRCILLLPRFYSVK
ncbi:MAG: hypothetical protein HYW26_02815 [Candidatus Aenigmarchaeota archaeon]|nr:hypothetical protein [Candidatus Aenigmarchaeota archaeon]